MAIGTVVAPPPMISIVSWARAVPARHMAMASRNRGRRRRVIGLRAPSGSTCLDHGFESQGVAQTLTGVFRVIARRIRSDNHTIQPACLMHLRFDAERCDLVRQTRGKCLRVGIIAE